LREKFIADLAISHRLPLISANEEYAAQGQLMYYGISEGGLLDQFRQAAGYIDRILKGAKPGDLPVQQPAKFQLSINLKTAKALGLVLAPTLVALADEVIE
jgi:putative ABC transport system substrate-binding protein